MVSMFSVVAVSNPVAAQYAPVQPSSGALPSGATANFTVTTTPYINVRPSVVGLGQIVLVNIWLLPAPNAHRLLLDMKVTITAPDGTKEVLTMDSYPADGTAWFEWPVDQLGQWKFKFDFPGMYYPAGRYLDGKIITASTGGTVYTSAYYKPSSTAETVITVQNDMVSALPASQMPSDYWIDRFLMIIVNGGRLLVLIHGMVQLVLVQHGMNYILVLPSIGVIVSDLLLGFKVQILHTLPGNALIILVGLMQFGDKQATLYVD